MNIRHQSQSGAALLEALLGILIFSLGILAVVGMQGSAIKASADAKYRSDASLLATQLIGQMWLTDRTASALEEFQGGNGADGAAYTNWLEDVQVLLPGSQSALPRVTVNPANNQIIVELFWRAPGEPEDMEPHQFVVVTQVI